MNIVKLLLLYFKTKHVFNKTTLSGVGYGILVILIYLQC